MDKAALSFVFAARDLQVGRLTKNDKVGLTYIFPDRYPSKTADVHLNLFAALAIKEGGSLATDVVDLQDIAAPCLQLFDDLADLWKAAAIRQFIRDAYMYRDAKPEAEESGVDVAAHVAVLLLEG